jgi:hypothetical protein
MIVGKIATTNKTVVRKKASSATTNANASRIIVTKTKVMKKTKALKLTLEPVQPL